MKTGGFSPAWTRSQEKPAAQWSSVLVTGGAGFIGANLADRLATSGERVLILDNLSRTGVEENLYWLTKRHGGRVRVEIGDIRDERAVRRVVREAGVVFHCAAQVAVTTSISTPVEDFEVNARGTLNLLEAIRSHPKPPPLLFTSTNKVYGRLAPLSFEEKEQCFAPRDLNIRAAGINESQPMDFYSPHGCSKGAADQYVLDYARIYGLQTVVFRMSCIYGPRQLGTEDQGWVAHFMLSALRDEPLTLFGNGKQVRDILYVDDLIEAMLLAMRRIETVSGTAFNIGGGPDNAVSLLTCLDRIASLHGREPAIDFAPWRPGDQPYYVSDCHSFRQATGWRPAIDKETGLARLYRWLKEHHALTMAPGEPAMGLV